jgi:peptide methionine sulfoxide reductase MsrA
MVSASIMVVNMWKYGVKNVEYDNNKILYKTLLNFFYSETVLTF